MATNVDGMIRLIANNIDVAQGAEAETLAKDAYMQAVDSIAKQDCVPWNKLTKTATLTASTGSYTVATLLDRDDVRGILSIYITDEKNWEVQRKEVYDFNRVKRGDTTEGKVYWFTQYNDENNGYTVEFFYTPDSAYNIWVLFRVPLTYDLIPDEYKDVVLWKAMMIANKAGSSYYNKGESLYMEAMNRLREETYERWEGTHIKPDYIFGNQHVSRMRADSGKFWSGLG